MLFRFGVDVPHDESLEVLGEDQKPDEKIAQWMSLIAPFPIPDPDDPSTTYPSIEHYLAAMKLTHAGKKLKGASSKPDYLKELAKNLFSSKTGTIHQDMIRERDQIRPPVRPDSERDYEMLLSEAMKVRKMSTDAALKTYHVTLDDTIWDQIKDATLYYALEYRMKHDKRFETGVRAAITDGRDLLYSINKAGKNTVTAEELGGERILRGSEKHTIKGENKVGKMLMEIASTYES
jgi:predicted NAD-dependent protein-ADP-ribosyltransferase YbiA (DUF1768 family)